MANRSLQRQSPLLRDSGAFWRHPANPLAMPRWKLMRFCGALLGGLLLLLLGVWLAVLIGGS